MANVTVYNRSTGEQYTIGIDCYQNVINGQNTGTAGWYISVHTTKRTPHNEVIPAYIIEDIPIAQAMTYYVELGIEVIMRAVEGEGITSSSSSSLNSSSSSYSSPSSQSSPSSASSPSSQSSPSSASSPSSQSSPSSASSPSSDSSASSPSSDSSASSPSSDSSASSPSSDSSESSSSCSP